MSDETPAGTTPFPFWSRLWYYVRPFSRKFLFAIICTACTGIFMAIQPVSVKFIIDSGLNRPDSTTEQKLSWAMVFVGVYLLAGILRMVSYFIGLKSMITATEGLIFEIRSRFFRHIQRLCFKFHDKTSSGELFSYVMGSPLAQLSGFIRQLGLFFFQSVISWIVAVSALATFDFPMTLIAVATVVMIAFVNHRSRLTMKRMTTHFMEVETSVSRFVSDMFRGTRTIKIHAAEPEVAELFDERISEMRDESALLQERQWLEHAKPEFLHYFGLAFIYAFGVWSVLYRGMSVGTFMAFAVSVNQLIHPVMQVFQINVQRGNAEASLQRIENVMNITESTVESPEEHRVSIEKTWKTAENEALPQVEFLNVTFGYTDQRVLTDVSCAIPRNTIVGLVGPTGSGKSTFVKLLLRLYDPQSGTIRFNGADIREYGLRDLRSCFGMVPQDPYLFQTTIRENLRIVCPEAGDDQIREAMDRALVSEFVSRLPDGWDTMVGENGLMLSGGQRQRIAIARAILSKPDCFVFDEATSALDNVSETFIREAIENLAHKHTVIIIAHRLSTVKHADSILVLKNGTIVQQGTYRDLSEQDGLFRELVLSAV
jgi:ABC-type multidrug transport system fused ATPase/permease subunit